MGNRRASDGGHRPDFVIGKATTRGFHQSVLSKQLNPPVKWSYRKLILWWALAFLSIGWIVIWINTITKHSAAWSPPLTLFALLSAATFLLLPVRFWRHNQSAHKRRYSRGMAVTGREVSQSSLDRQQILTHIGEL